MTTLVAIQQVLKNFNIGAGATLRALEDAPVRECRRRARGHSGAELQIRRSCAWWTQVRPGVDRLQRPHDRFALPAGVW